MDVLCIGHAAFDLIFSVDHHPDADEKTEAHQLIACGGGPAANAAIAVARLGGQAGFCGYLGNDPQGRLHFQELQRAGVDTDSVIRGNQPTPVSCILVKPDGKRALVNYKGSLTPSSAAAFIPPDTRPKVLLCDGHEPALTLAAMNWLRQTTGPNASSILDAGSLHPGTRALMYEVEHLLASEKFARAFMDGRDQPEAALAEWASKVPVAMVTLGERGLLWRCGNETGSLPALAITARDTTGAGDAFHGAYAAGLAAGMQWSDLLQFASAAGSWCCTQMGARPGMPNRNNLETLLQSLQPESDAEASGPS